MNLDPQYHLPPEALDEAARALGDEYEQPAEWWLDDARLAIEAALPVLYRQWEAALCAS